MSYSRGPYYHSRGPYHAAKLEPGITLGGVTHAITGPARFYGKMPEVTILGFSDEHHAELFAASWDLLDACEAALLTLRINRRSIVCEPLEQKLTAALAKARGGK